MSEKDDTARKGDGGEIPQQRSQLRGLLLDVEREGWMDSGGTCVDVIWTSVMLQERERGGGGGSREALQWGLEA